MRVERIKQYLAYTNLSETDLEGIKRVISLKEACINHNISNYKLHSIMENMVNDAAFRDGPITKSGRAKTMIDCFTYENMDGIGTLWFWYNDKKKSTKVVQYQF